MEAKKSLKTAAACALSVAMLFAGAACGTSDGSDDAASSDSGSKSSELTGYDVSSVQKDDDIAKLLPDYVTKDGKLTIGMDTSYAPAEFLAEDGKTPIGFDVDIAKALANMFGLEAVPQTSNFDSIIPSIGTKYDIGISSFTITPERMEAVDFVSMFKATFHVGGEEGQSEQGRYFRPVRLEDRGADGHHAGRGSQRCRQTMQGRRQVRSADSVE